MDYANGKIYRIDCLNTNEVYIGSTCQPTLAKRLAQHVAQIKYWKEKKTNFKTSFSIIERGNYKISLIELFPCNTKDELSAQEGFYIRNIKCVNKCITGRTQKEWSIDNKDKISNAKKEYYEINKEQIKERTKEYYEINKEQLKERMKEYYEINKEQIKKYKNEKFTCNCGGKYTYSSKSTHFKSLKHLNVVADTHVDTVKSEGLGTTEDFITV
jgi:hypothetical protein